MANSAKKIAPPAATLSRNPTTREIVVLNVPFDDREIAKKSLGAQFDGNSSVWFINPNTAWNRSGISADTMKIINDKKWFRGFSHIAPEKYNPSVNYRVPISQFSWIGDKPTLTNDSITHSGTRNNFHLYCWRDKSRPGNYAVSILIDTLGYADKEQWTAYLILWMHDGRTVSSINQMTMIEARKYWDELTANTTYIPLNPSAEDKTLPGKCNWVPEIYLSISTFIQQIELTVSRNTVHSTTDTQYAISA